MGWRDGSAFKSICNSCRRPRFCFAPTLGSRQPIATAVPWDLVTGFSHLVACDVHTDKQAHSHT